MDLSIGRFHIDPATADLHNHTTYSDGLLTPAEVVQRAKGLGLAAIAITDHDGAGGIREAVTEGHRLGVTVIPGVEVSTEDENEVEYHILGYDFDPEEANMKAYLNNALAARIARNEKLFAALREEGYDISITDVMDRPDRIFIGKPNIARVLVQKGYFENKDQVFQDLLERPRYKSIKKNKVTPFMAIELILGAGGVPVWAHPGKTRDIGEKGSPGFYKNIEEYLDRFVSAGLAGLECFHPGHDKDMADTLCTMAAERGLFITKGSDFHGD